MKKLTNFFNCAAKAAQKTGGGNSLLPLRSEGAQRCETRGVNHAIITQLSPNNHPITLRAIRYVAVLLMVFMVGIGNVWGANPYYASQDWGSDDFSSVVADHTNVVITSSATAFYSNLSGKYYIQCGSSSDITSGYMRFAATEQIDSVSIFFIGNSTTAAGISWCGWGKNVTPSVEVGSNYGSTATFAYSAKNYDNARWMTIDVSDKNLYTLQIFRQGKNLTNNGNKISNFGANQTINILGIKVWLHPAAATKFTITYAKGEYGTGDAIANGEKTKDVAFTLSSSTYSRENYTQQGWSTTDGGAKAYDLGGSYTANADITLYPFWVSSAAATHDISYTNTKGATNSNPAKYTEGVGVASFEPLADVTDFHFTGWSPASISTTATEDQTIEAQWVAAYDVTFSAGAGSGTVPASFQKWEGAKFNLPGQGSMTAPAGKVFDGWKANGAGDKLAADAEYTMGGAEVEFVAQWKNTPTTLFHWQSNISSNPSLDQVISATGGSLTTRSYKTSGKGSFQTQSVSSYVEGTPDDMKVNSGKSGVKCNNSDVYLKLALTSGKLQSGDTIWICGYGAIKMYKSITLGAGFNDEIASLSMSGTSSNTFGVNATACVIPQVGGEDVEYDSLCLTRNSSAYLAAIKIVRPAAKDVKSTVVTLSDAKVNGTSISAANLATLQSSYTLALSDALSAAPTITFNKHTVITYDDNSEKETDTPIEETATINSDGKWEASATIEAVEYTITIPKAVSTDATLSSLTYQLGSADPVAISLEENKYAYAVELPFGTTTVPTVAGTANDANAKSVVVTQASALPGSATVVVTAEDNSTKTYTVNFTVADSKDLLLVFRTGTTACSEVSTASAMLSDNAAVSSYINKITFNNVEGTGDNGKETGGGSGSLDVGKKAGNMLTLSAKPGYALQAMSFYGKIQDETCEYSLDGGDWTTLSSTNTGGDACYTVFSDEEVHEFRLRSTGASGVWIRNMELDIIAACTPKTIAWTTEPAAEYEVGKSGYTIAASANNGNVTYAASNAAITVAANGALTINSLTNDIDITASVAGGDGTTYCAAGASVAKEDIKTYYLVKFNAQNETDATEVKYYSGDAAIALPATPSYPGYVFQGWFDAAEGGDAVTGAITPEASMTVYAQWEAQCVGPTITTQPASANYFVGRTAAALSCAATPGVSGKALTYTWYSCDDTERTNPVELAGAPTPSTAAVGTFYYYCAVTEEDCDVIRNSNVVTINVTEKDMLLLIQANHVKGKTATISGYIGGTYRKEMQDNSKLGSKGNYFGIKLASGTFQAGDRVYIHTAAGADTNGDYVRIFKSNAASAENVLVEGTEAMVSPNGDNWVTLPETTLDSLYLRRGTDTENYNKNWNPYIDIFAVYRPYPVPVLTAMTVNGSAATIVGTNVAATIASNAELASLTIVPTFMSNDPENTNGALGDWTEVSEGVYTASYVVTDKDGDTNTYTITLTRDVEIASVTISGETTVAEESQITLTATVLPDNVANKAVVWSSSDETKAVVDANGVVTGKAAGAVTITATAVADNTKFGTYDITVTGFIGTKRAYWFAYADDAAANGVTNNSAVFGGAPTGSNSGAKAITLEEGWTVNTTKKAGAPGSTGTFVVPAEYTATFYAVVKGSGSSGRYLKLKQGDNVKYTSEEFGSTDPTVLKIEGVVAGTYTIVYEGGMSNFYLYAAELNRYAISSATLESGFTLRTENKRTPEMTLVHAKAAIASQTWSIVSSTATGTTINASTGEITAGTTPGTITVQVVVEDVMGNEVTSNICTVEIVEMFERLDVTGDITWNWNAAANEENVYVSTANGLALANYIAGDDWKYISGTNNDWAYNTNNSGSYQGTGSLSFYTTVPGILKISGKRISNNAVITINGTINAGTLDGNVKTLKALYVPAGEVTIAPDENGMRITKIEFKATADYSRPNLNPNNIGTLCWTNNAILGGATLYELTGKNENNYLVFDEVEENRLEAGKPYIFVPENGNTEIKVYNTDNATALTTPIQNESGMQGTFVELSSADGTTLWGNYVISKNHYIYVDSDNVRLGANRAYVIGLDNLDVVSSAPTPGTNGAPRRRLVMGGNAPAVATDIDNIFDNDTKVQKILINGQLFIIRGEKMYDATGRFVK